MYLPPKIVGLRPACAGDDLKVESDPGVLNGRREEVRASILSMHGVSQRPVRQILQRALQGEGTIDGVALRLPTSSLSVTAH
jgi:hypothetical protein